MIRGRAAVAVAFALSILAIGGISPAFAQEKVLVLPIPAGQGGADTLQPISLDIVPKVLAVGPYPFAGSNPVVRGFVAAVGTSIATPGTLRAFDAPAPLPSPIDSLALVFRPPVAGFGVTGPKSPGNQSVRATETTVFCSITQEWTTPPNDPTGKFLVAVDAESAAFLPYQDQILLDPPGGSQVRAPEGAIGFSAVSPAGVRRHFLAVSSYVDGTFVLLDVTTPHQIEIVREVTYDGGLSACCPNLVGNIARGIAVVRPRQGAFAGRTVILVQVNTDAHLACQHLDPDLNCDEANSDWLLAADVTDALFGPPAAPLPLWYTVLGPTTQGTLTTVVPHPDQDHAYVVSQGSGPASSPGEKPWIYAVDLHFAPPVLVHVQQIQLLGPTTANAHPSSGRSVAVHNPLLAPRDRLYVPTIRMFPPQGGPQRPSCLVFDVTGPNKSHPVLAKHVFAPLSAAGLELFCLATVPVDPTFLGQDLARNVVFGVLLDSSLLPPAGTPGALFVLEDR